MKPSEFFDSDQETSVFDRSRTGQSVGTERWDEPGDEHPQPGDGGSAGAENAVPGLVTQIVGRLAHGDAGGDWSWKPKRTLVITGPRCTCTLQAPVGTRTNGSKPCERHSTYKSPTVKPLQTYVRVS